MHVKCTDSHAKYYFYIIITMFKFSDDFKETANSFSIIPIIGCVLTSQGSIYDTILLTSVSMFNPLIHNIEAKYTTPFP